MKTVAARTAADPTRQESLDALPLAKRRCYGGVIWLTGLPSAGKTTLAQRVYEHLEGSGIQVELLDGDSFRLHLCRDLGFSRKDREENIRRLGFVAALLARNGIIALVAAISPYRSAREEVRCSVKNFVEVYVNAPVPVCEGRDVKGLYRKARGGQLKQFTGVDDPYEPPLNPEIECHTDVETIDESVNKILYYVEQELLFPRA
jgi:adenylylsulfate kinase